MAKSTTDRTQALNQVCLEEGVQATILDKHYTSWTMGQIRDILRFYGVRHNLEANVKRPKLELMRKLARLVDRRGLTRSDRLEIARYSGGGGRVRGPRPPKKPIIQRAARRGNQDNTISDKLGRTRSSTNRNNKASQHLARPNFPHTEALDDVNAPSVRRAEAFNAICTVCFEDLNLQNSVDRNITASCSHKSNVCKACLSKSISAQFTSRIWNKIDCPTCGERLDSQDVKDFAEPEIFEK